MRGFDPWFTRGGAFGNEDIDFGYQLLPAGYRIEFNPRAISWQRYVVGPAHYLKQWHDVGSADVASRRHPEQAQALFALNGAEQRTSRWLWQPLACGGKLSAALLAPLRWLSIALVERGAQD